MSAIFDTRLHVILFMKSGRAIKFTCDEITAQRDGTDLTKLTVKGAKGWPTFLDLSEIEAVCASEKFAWFGLRR